MLIMAETVIQYQCNNSRNQMEGVPFNRPYFFLSVRKEEIEQTLSTQNRHCLLRRLIWVDTVNHSPTSAFEASTG